MRRLIKAMPGVPSEGLSDDVRDQLERTWNARNKAELLEIGSILFTVEFGVGHYVARAGGSPKSRDEGLGSLLENLCVRGIAIPTFAHQRHPTVLRPHQR